MSNFQKVRKYLFVLSREATIPDKSDKFRLPVKIIKLKFGLQKT